MDNFVPPEIEFIWKKGLVRIEELPGGQAYLYRRHVDDVIPGEYLATCVISEISPYSVEVKAWRGEGESGPTTRDRRAIEEFCIWTGYTFGYWRRERKGRPPKVTVFLDLPDHRSSVFKQQ